MGRAWRCFSALLSSVALLALLSEESVRLRVEAACFGEERSGGWTIWWRMGEIEEMGRLRRARVLGGRGSAC